MYEVALLPKQCELPLKVFHPFLIRCDLCVAFSKATVRESARERGVVCGWELVVKRGMERHRHSHTTRDYAPRARSSSWLRTVSRRPPISLAFLFISFPSRFALKRDVVTDDDPALRRAIKPKKIFFFFLFSFCSSHRKSRLLRGVPHAVSVIKLLELWQRTTPCSM